VILFSDATILTETPPLRGAWAPIGVQAQVPITGNHDKWVLFGALAVKSGKLCLAGAKKWDQRSFHMHLRQIRSIWRGWRIVLFVDRGSPHMARGSRQLARELGIELRFLPTACPELNPLEGLWRGGKAAVVANEPTPSVDSSAMRLCAFLLNLSPRQRLQMAGVLSGHFWLPT
jgi:hypothetical protein